MTRSNSLAVIILIYLMAAILGFMTYTLYNWSSEILAFLVADLVMTVFVFACSIIRKNASIYDAYWSVIPFYFVAAWSVIHFNMLNAYHAILFLVVSIWSWRLTLNWVRSWSGMEQEDWRYRDLAEKTGIFYPVVNFLGIHLFPTILVFAGMYPLFHIFEQAAVNTSLFWAGMACAIFGIYLEYQADNQLARFRQRDEPKKSDLLQSGIWSVIRHPNYLGEMLFWLGISISAYGMGAALYTLTGPPLMIFLFLFISIPMKEKRMLKHKEGYDQYASRVSKLIPGIY